MLSSRPTKLAIIQDEKLNFDIYKLSTMNCFTGFNWVNAVCEGVRLKSMFSVGFTARFDSYPQTSMALIA